MFKIDLVRLICYFNIVGGLMNKKNAMRDFIKKINDSNLMTQFIKNIFNYENFYDYI